MQKTANWQFVIAMFRILIVQDSFRHIFWAIWKSSSTFWIKATFTSYPNIYLAKKHFHRTLHWPCNRYKPDYSVTSYGFFHMCDLGVSFTFHFRKKKYGIIRNIFTEWCFDPYLKREQGSWCNLFWDKDSKEKEQEIITESPIKKYIEVILFWKKTKTFFGLSIITNIITEK
jgi:hypothetical protein